MTLPFQKQIINENKYSTYNFQHPNFIGYLNKYGDVLDYSNPLGLGGHNCDRTTTFFERYFHMPMNDIWMQQSKGINDIGQENEEQLSIQRLKYFKDLITNNIYSSVEDVNDKLWHDLELFFFNCYQARTFMDGFGQNCMILNKHEFYEVYYYGKENEQQDNERNMNFFERDYHWYKKKTMLEWYKTVLVQNMHYHLIERCEKGITTSDSTPYETFYNYLLNDFKIHQIPRMIFDSENKKYVPYIQNEFLISDNELRLKEEIKSIKKLVPLKDRYKFYK